MRVPNKMATKKVPGHRRTKAELINRRHAQKPKTARMREITVTSKPQNKESWDVRARGGCFLAKHPSPRRCHYRVSALHYNSDARHREVHVTVGLRKGFSHCYLVGRGRSVLAAQLGEFRGSARPLFGLLTAHFAWSHRPRPHPLQRRVEHLVVAHLPVQLPTLDRHHPGHRLHLHPEARKGGDHLQHRVLRQLRLLRDAAPPAGRLGDEVRVAALLLLHHVDHPLVFAELLLRRHHLLVRDLAHPRHHLHHLPHRSHVGDHLELLQKVVVVKLVRHHLVLHALRVLLLDCRLRFFYQRQNIAHAQDAACHALRVKRLQRVHLLAGANKLDGLPRHLTDSEGSATATVAVRLGEQRPRQLHLVVE
mmetsp:Transcript_26676/g.47478  ORF Transcript_26676/g.47478 Transcript_26676/m.47478 type:complete len:365 (+) Transcript_26676:138-1232(+)